MTYASWIESVVGEVPPARKWVDNEITGAIGHPTFFRKTFEQRIKRLWDRYPTQRKEVLEKIANVGTAGWAGPFAELVAADFFAATGLRVELEPMPGSPVLGERFGKGRSQLDGKLPDLFSLHYEVKILSDVSSEVLASIREDIEGEFDQVWLGFNYSHDLGETTIANARSDLKREIREAILAGKRHTTHAASRVQVSIQPMSSRSMITEHDYHPYRQAENRHRQVLQKWHQLIEEGANLRVFVVHPWFNGINAQTFGGSQDVFFRALARRVFCGLTKDASAMDDAPGLTVSDIASRLSGILFIVDHSAVAREGEDPSTPEGLMRGFLHQNPNTTGKANAELQFDQLFSQNPHLFEVNDDFEHDNY